MPAASPTPCSRSPAAPAMTARSIQRRAPHRLDADLAIGADAAIYRRGQAGQSHQLAAVEVAILDRIGLRTPLQKRRGRDDAGTSIRKTGAGPVRAYWDCSIRRRRRATPAEKVRSRRGLALPKTPKNSDPAFSNHRANGLILCPDVKPRSPHVAANTLANSALLMPCVTEALVSRHEFSLRNSDRHRPAPLCREISARSRSFSKDKLVSAAPRS